jgi:CrcB protein
VGPLMSALAVGVGGFFGAIARYLVALAVARRLGTAWPYGTFVINMSGCFAIGFFVTLTSEKLVIHDAWRLLFPIGFVGAYTTFSTYELETARLIADGAWARAASYVVASTLVGFAAVVLAMGLARRL